ncbi:MAG: hypothetical protein AAFP22_23845, partial [Planctomycetota bacterium]
EATGQPVALVSFSPEGGDADAVLERLAGVLIDSGAPLERAGGGFTLESPAGPVLMRSLGGRHLSISLGDLPAAPPRAPDRTMFVDARAAFSFSLDFAKLAPVAGMAAGQAPPEATAALEEAGLIGQDAMRIDFAMGHSDDAAHEIVRLTGRRGPWTELGLLQADPLTAADFRAVPRNAASVAAVALDLSAVVGLVDMITEATGEDPLALVREQIGIDLRGDLFPHLGDRIVSYNTGGPAGFLGTVAMVEIDNPAAFLETHAQIVDLIRTSQWTVDTVTNYAKMFQQSVATHAGRDSEPYVLKYDLDSVLVLALLRPKGQDHFTPVDLRRGFETVTSMLEHRIDRRPAAEADGRGG